MVDKLFQQPFMPEKIMITEAKTITDGFNLIQEIPDEKNPSFLIPAATFNVFLTYISNQILKMIIPKIIYNNVCESELLCFSDISDMIPV